MKKTFIQTKEFSKNWDALGLNDQDLRRLEADLLANPEAGSIIRGTGSLRKIRFAFENRGKSGSTRVCYVDFVLHETIYLITIYAKNEQENLSNSERNEIKKVIICLEQELNKGVDKYEQNI